MMREYSKKLLLSMFEAFCVAFGFAFGAALVVGMILLLALLLMPAQAKAAPVETIPRAALQYRSELIRVSRAVWGMDAPIAVFAAQVHTESGWNSEAVSPVGAQGLAQFMPATARWLPQAMPESGQPTPYNPGWALRALVSYDFWLHQRVQGRSPFERMAFALSAYNGGLGWVQRDKKQASASKFDPARWFGQVENVNAGRSTAAFSENRAYVRRILKERQQRYASSWNVAGLPIPAPEVTHAD